MHIWITVNQFIKQHKMLKMVTRWRHKSTLKCTTLPPQAQNRTAGAFRGGPQQGFSVRACALGSTFLHSYLGRDRGHNSIQNSRGGGLFILSQHYDLANTRQGWLLKSNLTNVGIYFHRKKDLKNTYIHNYELMQSLLIIDQKFRKIVAQIVSLLYSPPPPPQGLGCCLVNKGELKNTSK